MKLTEEQERVMETFWELGVFRTRGGQRSQVQDLLENFFPEMTLQMAAEIRRKDYCSRQLYELSDEFREIVQLDKRNDEAIDYFESAVGSKVEGVIDRDKLDLDIYSRMEEFVSKASALAHKIVAKFHSGSPKGDAK